MALLRDSRREAVLFFLVLFFSLFRVTGQQDPHFTQYMFNTMRVNPAYSGSMGHPVITGIARTQWIGIQGAPDSQSLSFDTPLGVSGFGLGVNITNDQVGPSQEIFLDGNISYGVSIAQSGTLAFGLKLGARHLGLDWSRGTSQQQETVFDENYNKFLPTLGAGLYYYTDRWYAGLAVPSIFSTEHYDDTLVNVSTFGRVAQERFHIFTILGYVFDVTDRLKFKPASLIKVVSGAPLSLDISGNFLWQDKYRLGLAWRWDDAASILLGLQATNRMHIGVAYDLTTSNYRNYNSGTLEAFVRWEFLQEEILKSPRFF